MHCLDLQKHIKVEYIRQATVAVFIINLCVIFYLFTLKAPIFFIKIMETKGFFQFEIIINVLFSSFRFI